MPAPTPPSHTLRSESIALGPLRGRSIVRPPVLYILLRNAANQRVACNWWARCELVGEMRGLPELRQPCSVRVNPNSNLNPKLGALE